MARRAINNKTNIPRIAGVSLHGVFAFYVCVRCSSHNHVELGGTLLTPSDAYESQSWKCAHCGFVHDKAAAIPQNDSRGNPSPFSTWDAMLTKADSLGAQRFWKAFFTIATENKDTYWKQCNTCGRILPSRAFSRHAGWGPLEKQMECRSCKAIINVSLNPKRTKEQLHESASRRRTADLLLAGTHERLDLQELFDRFGGKCFKTGKVLEFQDRKSWAVDHLLPSRWLYPLSVRNAVLLSKESNDNKRDSWPSQFYTNEELKRLARMLGAELALLASSEPVINQNIDVDACVTRMLTVRRATDMTKRIKELKKLLDDYELVEKLSDENKKILGYV